MWLRFLSVVCCGLGFVLQSGQTEVPNGAAFVDVALRPALPYVTDNHFTGRKYFPQPMCGGVAVLDFDRDGHYDLFFTNGAELPANVKSGRRFWNALWRNQGDGTFKDVTQSAGLIGEGLGYNFGVAAADFDNDGYTDLFLANLGSNTIYRNQGDGTFKDVTENSGLLSKGPTVISVGGAWFDYNKDGLLDLVVSNYTKWTPSTDVVCRHDKATETYCSPTAYQSVPHQLYRNLGNGRFEDVTESSGFGEALGKGMGIAIADFNNDGWDDVFIANDTVRNFLYINHQGERFEEVGLLMGVGYNDDGNPVSSMGCDAKDYDNDGSVDIFYNDLPTQIFALFRNRGGEFFEYISQPSGIADLSRKMAGWSTGFVDYNNDGWKDIYSSSGDVDSLSAASAQHDVIYENVDGKRFREVSAGLGRDFLRSGFQRGSAFVDFNNDGRMDLVVTSLGMAPRVLRNDVAPKANWLLVALQGRTSNRDAIGAKLTLTLASGRVLHNHLSTSVGFLSSSDPRVHFGLGAESDIKLLEIAWPNGTKQVIDKPTANKILNFVEPE